MVRHSFLLRLFLALPASASLGATVNVDGSVEYQTIDGGGTTFGTEGDPLPIPLADGPPAGLVLRR
jgi:hypothetical protein